MSNNTITSQFSERFSRDELHLKDIVRLYGATPVSGSYELRASALLIQDRWRPFEGQGQARAQPSRAFTVENLGGDISAYLMTTWGLIKAYMGRVQAAYLLLLSMNPLIVLDVQLVNLGALSLNANLANASKVLDAFLQLVANNFPASQILNDDRDVDRAAQQLDDSFHAVQVALDPDSRVDSNHKAPFNSIDTIEFPNVYVTSPDVQTNLVVEATTPTNAILRPLAAGSAAAVVGIFAYAAEFPVYVAIRLIVNKPIRNNAGTANIDPVLVGAAIVGTPVAHHNKETRTGGSIWYTYFIRMSAAGTIGVSLSSWGNEVYWLNATVEDISSGDGYARPGYMSLANRNETVLTAMGNGRLSVFTSLFHGADVERVLKYVSRRDQLARQAGITVLSDHLVNIWVANATAAGAAAGPLNYLGQNININTPFTPEFWGADPLAISTSIALTTPWVILSFEQMYRAFYLYLQAIINAGATDPYLIKALSEL